MSFELGFAEWLTRIEREYREMPGLILTERQMRRLWSLDEGTCANVVRRLVAQGVLRETPQHTYAIAASRDQPTARGVRRPIR